MNDIIALRNAVAGGQANDIFSSLYGIGENVNAKQTSRYLRLIDAFGDAFEGQREVAFFSTPGRTEVGGNHTDHNAGHILAAAVDMDVLALVGKAKGRVTINSEGYEPFSVDILDLEVHEDERGSSTALVRGVCARMVQLGYNIGGFNAIVTSDVLKGSGLSSSAAFEVEIASVMNHLYNDGSIDALTLAKIAQFAENDYFGKPCGLMDMTACAVGGFVMVDFKDFDSPIIEPVAFDFAKCGYTMVIVDTGGNHAGMTDDYTALENEMKAVARALGKKVLREVTKQDVLDNIKYLRTKVNDRAILRAFHFYDDDRRVLEQTEALKANDMDRFLALIVDSGRSSWELCQNCYSHKYIESQGISIALTVTQNILRGKGAYRVHGGGFAGTIQVFVPDEGRDDYCKQMSEIFGENAVFAVTVRPWGAIKISLPL